ncbi:hypothetical protein [Streptomyces sp. NPDC051001]|uniref:hypothetical protein n=1 Tax=Streptomyces sp. NPDC051001 TaxID=3155795 RepID=UPI003444A31B
MSRAGTAARDKPAAALITPMAAGAGDVAVGVAPRAAVGCSANPVPHTATDTAATPRTKEIASRVLSKDRAVATAASGASRRARAIRRVRARGPICGTVAPAVAPRTARSGVGRPPSAPATSAVIAGASTREKTRTTVR